MKEKRKAQRKQTNEFFGIYHRATDEFIGKLLDLSIMGMKIQAVQEMDVGCIYDFRIDLPKPILGHFNLAFHTECVWCNESTTSKGEYDIGFEVKEKLFEKIDIIKHLLDNELFHDSKEQPRLTLAKKSNWLTTIWLNKLIGKW